MAFPEINVVMRRVGEALSYDLLGSEHNPQGSEEQNADTAVNGHLGSPLYSDPVVERVDRYEIDPQIAGDLYLATDRTGVSCGYSFINQTSDGIRNATGDSINQGMFVEVSIFAVINGARAVIEGERGFTIDERTDDVSKILGGERRGAPKFSDGIQTVTQEDITRLDGASEQGVWMGRAHTFRFQRNMRSIQ